MTRVALVGVAIFAFLGTAQSQTASLAVSARLNPAAQAGTSTIAFTSTARAIGYSRRREPPGDDRAALFDLAPQPVRLFPNSPASGREVATSA